MTMNVLAGVLTPAAAKPAANAKGASTDGAKSGDFAAMLEAAPANTGQSAVAGAKAKPQQDKQPETAAVSSEEAQASTSDSTGSDITETQHGKVRTKAAKTAKKEEKGGDAAETGQKTHMPSENASAVAQAVVPVATAPMPHGEGEPSRGSVVSAIASARKAAQAADTQPDVPTGTDSATETDISTVAAGGETAPVAGEETVETMAAIATDEENQVADASDGTAGTAETKAVQVKPGEATELLQQLSKAYGLKPEARTEKAADETGKPVKADSGNQAAAAAGEGPVKQTGQVRSEIARTDARGATVTRPETGAAVVVRPEVSRADAAQTEAGRPAFAQDKASNIALSVRQAQAGAHGTDSGNSRVSAEGTAALAASVAASAEQGAGSQGDGETSDKREQQGLGRIGKASASVQDNLTAGNFASIGATVASAEVGAVQPDGVIAQALDQQVIDMGVSGQWLDSISHQIATVAASKGQGSFTISPENLGGIHVDITQGEAGAQVHMTVDNEAARMALTKDGDRLLKDAQLSSVRIAELRVDLASRVGETARSDMNQNNNGQQGNQSQSQWNTGANGNAAGQGQRNQQFAMGGEGQGNGSNGNQSKSGGNNAVSMDVKQGDGTAGRAGETLRARYA